jgi:ATP-dependent DNA helicase RecQ
MAVQSALYLLERAGHIHRLANSKNLPGGPAPWETAPVSAAPAREKAGRPVRTILLLDNVSPNKVRVAPADVERRAALERRKLREMIEFCYTEYCYRAHILDYFGDRHHARQCGTCGNCTPNSQARAPLSAAETLGPTPSTGRARRSPRMKVAPRRELSDDETLRVRKILACAARLKGRFGKQVLAASLRGSAAKNVLQAHLDQLSTYGLLRDMRQEDLARYIDALIAADCLRVSSGSYPTVAITELGERVMRETATVELALE